MAAAKWLKFTAAITISASVYIIWKIKSKGMNKKVLELEKSVKSALEKCNAERQGRIRAQQALRKALANPNSDSTKFDSYPMIPIAVIKSCYSTRNGTPRQPLLVPLAKACLIFDPARAPQASLDGLEGYSHCWIIYVFHLNTDLQKLWTHPSRSKLKAKVRVPSLEGEKIGVFATRSPHRPCPIGLTVAKVEEVQGHKVLLSGVDLVDGTPVLDVKPYLPYCDSIEGAIVPDWVKVDNKLAVSSVNFSPGFPCSLDRCWLIRGKNSLYASAEEFQGLIKQVLSWDIRSLSQKTRPHNSQIFSGPGAFLDGVAKFEKVQDDETPDNPDQESLPCDVMYYLTLEDFIISYKIDNDGNVLVEEISLSSSAKSGEVTAAA